ncbi:zinc finger protein OZF-like [Penaeus monodon]|uniref:zinc finger protein OZF-like n=1 Tax=Penaeus monodon TaxID=6687 RepID=UPI0018A6F3F6|nr:zinc finger protein OZF-like [Penaeus monodon]
MVEEEEPKISSSEVSQITSPESVDIGSVGSGGHQKEDIGIHSQEVIDESPDSHNQEQTSGQGYIAVETPENNEAENSPFCDTCRKKFSSERALTRHVQLHKTYPCKLCDNIFFRKAKLKKHLEDHTQDSLACKVCSKECTSLQALISHMKTHTQKKKVNKCNVCSKIFANNRNLKVHMRTHTGEKPFVCENCGRSFSHRSNMQTHHDTCTGQFSHRCQICGRGFALESVYRRHLAEHEGHYAHHCSICGRGFSKASGLQAHLATHNSQRPTYSCQVCGQTLSTPSSYSSHMASHTGEGGAVCPVCGKTLARRADLQDHLHRHTGTKTHTCSLCSATFYYRSNLNHHVKGPISHKTLYKCYNALISHHLWNFIKFLTLITETRIDNHTTFTKFILYYSKKRSLLEYPSYHYDTLVYFCILLVIANTHKKGYISSVIREILFNYTSHHTLRT